MTPSTGDGPADGDFARYVEQLTSGLTPPSAPSLTTPGATGKSAGASRASAPSRRKPIEGAAAGGMLAPSWVWSRILVPFVMTALMMLLTWIFQPSLLPAVVILGGAWLVSMMIRVLAQAVRQAR